MLKDIARQAGANSNSAVKAVEAVVFAAEREGALVREVAAFTLIALREYRIAHGDQMLLAEIEDCLDIVEDFV